MAEPSEGVYIVRSVGSSKVLDVKGGSDKSGANVQQWNQNNSDAQMWAFDKQSGGWQILCSLTGKCLDVENGKIAANTNVRQWSDNNSNAQRWNLNVVTTTSGHDVVTIKCAKNTSLSLAVKNNSGTAGANIILASSNDSSNYQRWELIPVPVLTTGGTYEIVLAADTKMCLDIAGGSTANKANLQVYTRNNSTSQIFRAAIDDQSDTVVLYNGKSNKVLEVAGGGTTAGTNVQQYTANNSSAQKWLIQKSGNVKINGQTVPTYELHAQVGSGLVMDCKGGNKTAKTNIQVWNDNNSIAQRFAFVKTELVANDISVPGAIQQTLQLTDGKQKILSGLQFASKETMFQARYMVRYYTKGRKSYKSTKWMNLKNNAAAHEGWGDAWTYTFKATPQAGVVTIPIKKTITIPSGYIAADVYFEIRTYTTTYKSGFRAHGKVKQTVVKIRQNPKVTWKSTALKVDNNKLGLTLTFNESVGEGCTRFRARLLNSQGVPISKYVNSTTTSLTFYVGSTLEYLPEASEKIKAEWTMLFKDNITKSGTSNLHAFTRGTKQAWGNAISLARYSTSGLLVVSTKKSNTNYPNACCVLKVDTVAGKKAIICPEISEKTEGNITYRRWRCAPPLNTAFTVELYGAKKNATSIYRYVAKEEVKLKSHNFLWNWGSSYGNYAILLINSDNPPQQTRNFETNISFHDTTGRTWPVAFSSRSLKGDLSVSGVVVDEGVNYQASEPLPEHAKLSYIKDLIPLSGKGIHPLYRTPYGDWYHVGIESVQFDKTAMYLSNVSVTQHVVED